MTLPNERYNAIKRTENFLKDLCDPTKTPRVPKSIRQQAYYCLRHYPGSYHLDVLATRSPSVLETQSPIDDLSMMIYDYEAKKK
jgi:hypothetical protein